MNIKIIRHGPKQRVKSHVTGTEALLDSSKIHTIKQFAQVYGHNKTYARIDSSPLPRNYRTAEIIVDKLKEENVEVFGPNIEEKLGGFAGKNGSIRLISTELSKIWGEAEKKYQTVEGVRKEDRGMFAWANYGLDKADGGISLGEVGFRIGDYILDKLENSDIPIIGISNSGFIESFIFATMDMIEQKNKTPVDYFHEIGGAVKPLEGITLNYNRMCPSFVNMELPNKKVVSVDLDILREQHNWLTKY